MQEKDVSMESLSSVESGQTTNSDTKELKKDGKTKAEKKKTTYMRYAEITSWILNIALNVTGGVFGWLGVGVCTSSSAEFMITLSMVVCVCMGFICITNIGRSFLALFKHFASPAIAVAITVADSGKLKIGCHNELLGAGSIMQTLSLFLCLILPSVFPRKSTNTSNNQNNNQTANNANADKQNIKWANNNTTEDDEDTDM